MDNAKKQLADWLEKKRVAIMAREKTALELMDKGDVNGYRDKMREKAEMLAALAKEADAADLPKAGLAAIRDQLENFSANASMALSLNSVFFMSALLYPDDHKPGQPDNLETLIAGLRE